MKFKKSLGKKRARTGRTFKRKRAALSYPFIGRIIKQQWTQEYPVYAVCNTNEAYGYYQFGTSSSRPGAFTTAFSINTAGDLQNTNPAVDEFYPPGYASTYQNFTREYQLARYTGFKLTYTNGNFASNQVVSISGVGVPVSLPDVAFRLVPGNYILSPQLADAFNPLAVYNSVGSFKVQPGNASSHGASCTYRLPARTLFGRLGDTISAIGQATIFPCYNEWNSITNLNQLDIDLLIGYAQNTVLGGTATAASAYRIGCITLTSYVQLALPIFINRVIG